MFWLLALTRGATMTIRTTRTTEEKLRYPTMKRSARRFLLAAHPSRVRSVIRRARRMRSSLRTCSPLVHAGHPWVSLTGQCYGCCTCRCTLRCTCVLPERERWDDDGNGEKSSTSWPASSSSSACRSRWAGPARTGGLPDVYRRRGAAGDRDYRRGRPAAAALGRRAPVRSDRHAACDRVGQRVLRSLLGQHVRGIKKIQHLPDAYLGDSLVQVAVQDAEHADPDHVPRGGRLCAPAKLGAHGEKSYLDSGQLSQLRQSVV